MKTHLQIANHLAALDQVAAWPELLELVGRAARHEPAHWKLPVIVCEAVSGSGEHAMPIVTALACHHISILLVDDMLDSDPRGEYRRIGHAGAANLAVALASAGQAALLSSDMESAFKISAVSELQKMNFKTALGQAWDQEKPTDEAAYWKVVRTKSAPFFGAAFYLGALAGRAAPAAAIGLRKLGCLYGELIQIHDDMKDALQVPASPDWDLGRASLPILYAELVRHPDQQAFQRLRSRIDQKGALARAQRILIRSGALSFGFHRLLQETARARDMLLALQLPRPAGIERLLGDLVRPIDSLLNQLGILKGKSCLEPGEAAGQGPLPLTPAVNSRA